MHFNRFKPPFILRVIVYLFLINVLQGLLSGLPALLSEVSPLLLVLTDLSAYLCGLIIIYIRFALVAGFMLGVPETLNPMILWLNYKGHKRLNQGRFREAFHALQQAMEAPDARDYTYRQKLNNLGLLYERLGHYPKALECYQTALKIQPPSTIKLMCTAGVDAILWMTGGKNDTLLRIGELNLSVGQPSQALRYFRQALAIAEETRNPFLGISAANNIGLVFLSFKEYHKALEYFQLAKTIYKSVHSPKGKCIEYGNILLNLGTVYRALGEYSKSKEYCQRAFENARRHNNYSLKCLALLNIGLVHDALGEYFPALRAYDAALSNAKNIGYRSAEAKILHHTGATLFKSGELNLAINQLNIAIDILDSLRASDLSDAHKIAIFETQTNTYHLLQEALIAQGNTSQALEIAERARARALVDLLARRLSSNQLQDLQDFDLTTVNIPLNIKQIQQIAQNRRATLVQYSITSASKLYIWVVKPSGEICFHQPDLNSLEQSLETLVDGADRHVTRDRDSGSTEVVLEALTRSIRDTFSSEDNLTRGLRRRTPELQTLYEILIKPIAELLPSNPNDCVIFIPYRSLFRVPFAALQAPDGTYLIQKHTILTAPSIQLLNLIRCQQQRLRVKDFASLQSQDFLIVGNPTMPYVGSKQLRSLDGAEQEANGIAELFGIKAMTRNQATKKAVTQKMSTARLVHLATHGLLEYGTPLEPDKPDFPGAVALGPSETPAKPYDRLLTASEIMDMNLKAELVVLSCCNTGCGHITGDGVIGLSRSLITAGVPNVIVSLLTVPDESTAFLMREFYQQWRENSNKAQALRQAMLTTMRKYPDPRNWAAFTLIGEA